MDNLLIFEYYATGEGFTFEIFFDQNMDNEKAIEKWKESHDPYFHVGLEVISLDDIRSEKHESLRGFIKEHVPLMAEYLERETKPCAFKVDYKYYYNLS